MSDYFGDEMAEMRLRGILELLGIVPHYEDSLRLLMQNRTWRSWLQEYRDMPIMSESEAMCTVLQQIFNAMRLPLTPSATDRIFNADLVLKGDEPPVIERGPLRINLTRRP